MAAQPLSNHANRRQRTHVIEFAEMTVQAEAPHGRPRLVDGRWSMVEIEYEYEYAYAYEKQH